MAKYAQIINGKVHGVFEYDPLPDFAPNIVMVPIDGVTPEPKAGWLYDGQTFSEPPVPPAPPVTLGVFEVSKYAIAADGVDVSVITYTSDDPVSFVVDDELVEVEPVDQVATLNVSADDFGPINVFVEGNNATISAYKVSP